MHALGPCGSPTNSPVRLGVSPAATSTPTGVFSQRFEALFPCWSPGWCGLSRSLFLPVQLCANARLQGLLPAAWSALFNSLPPHWVCQPPPCCESSLPHLPISASPTGLDECFFFISLVVGLPYSSIFFQFWLFFVFKLLLSFFWLCEEAQYVYLCLHLGHKSQN